MINNKRKLIIMLGVIIVIVTSMCGTLILTAAGTSEVPEAKYIGVTNADIMITNMDYTDLTGDNLWSKEAIYETGALGIMKGYGAKVFGRQNALTKEQAIALSMKVIGLEAEAQKQAEAINAKRLAGDKKFEAISMWSDGYLQLAKDQGLISDQDLTDAFVKDQTTLKPESFYRAAPAERQDMAYFMAMTTKIPPIYEQQSLFNNYADWNSSDPLKIPYIEAILQKKIMNGDGQGNFSPKAVVTREQAAQIIKNAEDTILPLLLIEKKFGTVEGINTQSDSSTGEELVKTTIDIRNSDGKLQQIEIQSPINSTDPNRNEKLGIPYTKATKDLVVYKNGKLQKANALKPGDRIYYYPAADKSIKFVNVISSTLDTKYIVGNVKSVDTKNLSMKTSQRLKLDYPVDFIDEKSYLNGGMTEDPIHTYRYSNNANVLVNGKVTSVDALNGDQLLLFTIQNDIVKEIKTISVGRNNTEGGVVAGIIEENNPQLGYMSLYNSDGTGISPEVKDGMLASRTYTYANLNNVTVYKNNRVAQVEDLSQGDTVFLKVDDQNNIESVSAVDNYVLKTARIITIRGYSMVLEFDDGTTQVLDANENTLISSGKKKEKINLLKDGDHIKLLLSISEGATDIKEIHLAGDESIVNKIYKGSVATMDDTLSNIIISSPQYLDNGQWLRDGQKGFKSIPVTENCKLYDGGNETSPYEIKKFLGKNSAYIAVVKDYGGQEKAVFVSFSGIKDSEAVYNDDIGLKDSGEFMINKEYKTISYDDGTIVIKDGKLVTGNSILQDDSAYIVANFDGTNYRAGVVKINEMTDSEFVQIYRGRIKNINQNKDFTIDSFSQLNGVNWDFANTPKTLDIDFNTQIITSSGLVNPRDFVGFGPAKYTGQTVYAVANGTQAILVSTAPFGSYVVKGEIYKINGGTIGEDGKPLTEPTGLNLWKTAHYDATQNLWIDDIEQDLTLLKESIILKDNKIAKASDLELGDKIKIFKKEDVKSKDAYIIIVE